MELGHVVAAAKITAVMRDRVKVMALAADHMVAMAAKGLVTETAAVQIRPSSAVSECSAAVIWAQTRAT
ncbi:MAG: hypothetical protein U0872_12500 [Planctomycetaceae bacterium]